MAFYYVKSGGTATGDGGRYTTQKTGSWATAFSASTEYYNDLDAAFSATTPPTNGDAIAVSDLHALARTGVTSNAVSAISSIGAPCVLISVDDANVDQYKPLAEESLDNNYDYSLGGNWLVAGMELGGTDTVILTDGVNSKQIYIDCIFNVSNGSSDVALLANSDGQCITWINCEVHFTTGGTSNFVANINGNVHFNWFGGKTVNDAGYIFSGGNLGGSNCRVEGVNLSSVDRTLVEAMSNTDDNVDILFQSCRLHASVDIVTGLSKPGQLVELYNCDDSTNNAIHRFHFQTGRGTAKNNDSTYVTSGETWYGGSDRSSIEITTPSTIVESEPFEFRLPTQLVDLSQTASDVLTIDLVTKGITLTDRDIEASLIYHDGTTPIIPRHITAGDILSGYHGRIPENFDSGGTTLSTSSLGASDWTGEPTTPNFYKIDLDTSGNAGSLCVVEPIIRIYKASIASGDLFIHPILTLS